MIRAVVDTNLIISGLFWRGLPGRIYDAAAAGKYRILVTTDMLAELARVLHSPKFATRLAAVGKSAEDLVADYAALTELVTPANIPSDAVRDRNDLPILACAVGGGADCIASGDQDLLTLIAYDNIPILNAEQFLKLLGGE